MGSASSSRTGSSLRESHETTLTSAEANGVVLGGLVLIFCSTMGMFCSMRREGRRRVAPD